MEKPPLIDREAAVRDKVETCACEFKYIKVGKISFVPTHSEEEKRKGIYSWDIVVRKK